MSNKKIIPMLAILIIGLIYLVIPQLRAFHSDSIENFKFAYKGTYSNISDITIKVNNVVLAIDLKSTDPIDAPTRISMIKSMESSLMKKEVFNEIDNYIKHTLNRPGLHYIHVKFVSDSSLYWYEVILSGRIPSNEKTLIHVFSRINEIDIKSGETTSTFNLN